jgi:hypothetical protein
MAEDPMRPDEQLAADRLDEAITAVLGGRLSLDTDPTLLWMAAATRPSPPPGLARRLARAVERDEARRWRPVQLAAALLGALFLFQGLGDIFRGEWIARGLGEAHSHHLYLEGGIALIAMAIVIGVGMFERRALQVGVAGGVPLGVAYGINGFTEIGQFAAGVALHMTELAVALVVLVLWWRARRYGPADPDEGGA